MIYYNIRFEVCLNAKCIIYRNFNACAKRNNKYMFTKFKLIFQISTDLDLIYT